MKIFLLLLSFCCSGCVFFTPYATWPNGSPVFPGAYKIESDKFKDPHYQPTTVEMLQRKAACLGPDPATLCQGS